MTRIVGRIRRRAAQNPYRHQLREVPVTALYTCWGRDRCLVSGLSVSPGIPQSWPGLKAPNPSRLDTFLVSAKCRIARTILTGCLALNIPLELEHANTTCDETGRDRHGLKCQWRNDRHGTASMICLTVRLTWWNAGLRSLTNPSGNGRAKINTDITLQSLVRLRLYSYYIFGP